jgi:hypothetical protein
MLTGRIEGQSPLGAALFAGACGLVVGGAVRARTRPWAAALCAIGALPAGFVGAMAAGGVDDFRSMYLRSVLFVASQAMVAMQAWHRHGARLDRALGVLGLWASWLGVAGPALGAPVGLRVLALAVGAAAIVLGLSRATADDPREEQHERREREPLTYRDGAFRERSIAPPPPPARSLLGPRLAELGSSWLGGGLATMASWLVVTIVWGVVSGVGHR